MPRRLQKTLIDYMAIAISPALIIALVGSLLFFLIEAFYAGRYDGRLCWIAFWFVLGVVCVARISIEEGYDRASLFGVPLAMAVAVAMHSFLNFGPHSALDLFSWWINFALMGIIWWCAHRLTWNCTVIDDRQDATGQGLLDAAGLDREAAALAHQADAAPDAAAEPRTLWQRARFWLGRRWKQATLPPGVWVIYFSLVALPLFSLGQLLVPASNAGSRRYVFLLLALYVASGLGLLMTTSFLGLRRYLRQRRLEMPPGVAGAWLGVGGVLGVGLMIAALLVPRPSAEYSISSVSGLPSDRSPAPSRLAPWRREGAEGQGPAGTSASAQQQAATGGGGGGQAGGQSGGSQDTSNASTTENGSNHSAASGGSDGSSGPSGSGSDSDGSGQSASNTDSTGGNGASDAGSGGDDSTGDQARHPGDGTDQSAASGGGQSSSGASSAQPPPDAPEPSSRPSDSSSWRLPSLSEGFTFLVRWAINLALLAVAIYLVVRYREQVRAYLRAFWEALRGLWQRLFGGQPAAATPAPEPPPPAPPPGFAAFPNPFITGEAGAWSGNVLVRYTFSAVEAWARDQGCPRPAEETALEFAERLAGQRPQLGDDVRRLGQLFSRVAYAGESFTAQAVAPSLMGLWSRLGGA